jgi:hypothetical protein
MADQVSVSPNGVPVAKGSRAKAFAGATAKWTGNALQGMAAHATTGVRRSRYESDTTHGDKDYLDYDVFGRRRGVGHFWQGPNREAFGGIDTSHDWRRFTQRNIPEGAHVMPAAGRSKRGEQSGRNRAASEGESRAKGKGAEDENYVWDEKTGQGAFELKGTEPPKPMLALGPGPKKPEQMTLDFSDPNRQMPLWSSPAQGPPYQGELDFDKTDKPLKPLTQPNGTGSSPRKGGIGKYGLDRFHTQLP